MTSYGQRFREVRKSLGLTQTEMRDRLAHAGFTLHQTQISRLERGEGSPLRLDAYVAIGKTFGIPVSAFVPGSPNLGPIQEWRMGREQGLAEARSALADL